jgi:hypothetical protein
MLGTSCGRLAKKVFEVPINLKNFLIRSKSEKEILSPKKDFLKICGSNLKVKDVSLLVSYKKPYDLVAQSQGRLDWRCSCDEIRMFYRQSIIVY